MIAIDIDSLTLRSASIHELVEPLTELAKAHPMVTTLGWHTVDAQSTLISGMGEVRNGRSG